MPDQPEPEWSDAWLLVALVYGKGDPVGTLSAADGLNRAIPTHAEWKHASVVLGERELIEATLTFLRATALGEAIVERVSSRKGVGLFRIAEFVLRDVERAPRLGEAILLPDGEVFEAAYHDYRRGS